MVLVTIFLSNKYMKLLLNSEKDLRVPKIKRQLTK